MSRKKKRRKINSNRKHCEPRSSIDDTIHEINDNLTKVYIKVTPEYCEYTSYERHDTDNSEKRCNQLYSAILLRAMEDLKHPEKLTRVEIRCLNQWLKEDAVHSKFTVSFKMCCEVLDLDFKFMQSQLLHLMH